MLIYSVAVSDEKTLNLNSNVKDPSAFQSQHLILRFG